MSRNRKRCDRVCVDCGRTDRIIDNGPSTLRIRCAPCGKAKAYQAFEESRMRRSAAKPMSTCKTCHRVYHLKSNRVLDSFCTTACRRIAGRVEQNCKGCGVLFTITFSGLKTPEERKVGFFCSYKCFQTFGRGEIGTPPKKLRRPRRFVMIGEPRAPRRRK